ncbi:8-amino-7-oxononanoate synthase [Paenarthrobacter sp. NPDC090522]|uniref:8-amino-7-oxononanoate synthase n=1 Tax=Paenarthrobacter sp. NPDC090522 TaxID=3364383 RepID=UPI00381E3D69
MTTWLEQQATVRERRGLTRTPGVRGPRDGMVDLAGNDYLGLATDPRLAEAAGEAAARWGTGATSSRLVAGTTELHMELEHELAGLVGADAALVFSSGYLANLGIITSVGGPGTLIVADEHCHASMIDGFRLSRSETATFRHNDASHAGSLLQGRTQPRALVVVESIYSVGGDAAPLDDLLGLAEEHDAVLLVDDAHGLGVAGSDAFSGRGSIAGTALAGHPNVVVTATLSKALGSQGGVVLGSALVREHLVNRSRSFIFDTALAPPAAAAALAAVGIIRQEPWRAAAVHRNAARLAAHLELEPSAGAMQTLRMPSAEAAVAASRAAAAAGVRVGCFRPPSVPDGTSRLRLTSHAGLTPDHLDHACAVLRHILEETP